MNLSRGWLPLHLQWSHAMCIHLFCKLKCSNHFSYCLTCTFSSSMNENKLCQYLASVRVVYLRSGVELEFFSLYTVVDLIHWDVVCSDSLLYNQVLFHLHQHILDSWDVSRCFELKIDLGRTFCMDELL